MSRSLGQASVTIAWPKNSRLVPVAANSVVVSFSQGQNVVQAQTIVRPSLGSSGTAVFTGLPQGAFTVTAQAFPTSQGTGVAQASATQTVTIVAGNQTPIAITMGSTIDHLVLVPASTSVPVGGTTNVTATPVDASGSTVLAPATVTFSSSNSSVATIDATGLLSAIAGGTVTITATESESGKSSTTSISIVPPSSGGLRPNAIYFGHLGDAGIISSILPDGTGRQDAGGGNDNVIASIPDPDHAGKMIYAAYVGNAYGIYRGATLDPSSSDVLVQPTFDTVSAMQTFAGGGLVFVAGVGGDSYLYRLNGGIAQQLDLADSAAVTQDGTRIAYSKLVNGFDQLFVWNVQQGGSTLVASDTDSLFPSFSRDGQTVLFSSDRGVSGTWDLYAVPTAGGTNTRLTADANVDKLGACFDPSGTKIAYYGIGGNSAQTGIYVLSAGVTQRIASDTDVNFAVYWTDASGRGLNVTGARYQRLTHPQTHRRHLSRGHA